MVMVRHRNCGMAQKGEVGFLKKRKMDNWKVWGKGIGILAGVILLILGWELSFGIHHSLKEFYIMYADFTTLLLILAPVLLVMLIAGIEKDFFRGFRLAFSGKKGISRIELSRSMKAFGYVERIVVLAAVVSLVFPLTDVFYHTDDWSLWALGPVFGVLSLGILYAAVFLLILAPIKLRLEGKIISYMEEPADAEEERKEAEGQRLFYGLRAMGLTDREAEVARLAAAGMTNTQISQELYISMATVKKHMTHVLEKTQCGDREALAEKVRGM